MNTNNNDNTLLLWIFGKQKCNFNLQSEQLYYLFFSKLDLPHIQNKRSFLISLIRLLFYN